MTTTDPHAYTDADFIMRSAASPPKKSPLLSSRAIIEAAGEVLAEQRNTIAALQARVEALEARADPAKRLRAVQSAPSSMIA